MNLENLRKKIDDIDTQLVMLIGQRLRVVAQIGYEKKRHNAPVDDETREAEVMMNISDTARMEGVDQEAVSNIFKLIIAISKKAQGV